MKFDPSNKEQCKQFQLKMNRVMQHIIIPAFKFWVQEHGVSLTSIDEFQKQLFTEESKAQVLNVSYLRMGPRPLKTIVFDIGFYDDDKRLVAITTCHLLCAAILKKE